MARLNEPAMSTDSIETLRRKFLRQNRELARINVDQSQRIRALENDVARMLSENLQLRSQVLHLENKLETSSTHRMADHALEVKLQLQEQLSIVSCLLEGLGTQPPRKRQTPSERRMSKAGTSPILAGVSPARRRRDIARDAEASKLQELRLPPIPEFKPYLKEPRATLNSEEIRALRGDPEPEDTTGSPDLGPPPVSRFVADDPVKLDSPSPEPMPADDITSNSNELPEKAVSLTPAPKLDLIRGSTGGRVTKDQTVQSARIRSEKAASTPAPHSQPLRAGAKRKYGNDENDVFRVLKQTDSLSNGGGPKDKARPLQDSQKRKSIRDLPASKREAGDKSVTPVLPLPNSRKALAAKSTNDSPRKMDNPVGAKETKPSKARPEPAADRAISRPQNKSHPLVQIPPPQPASVAAPVTTIPEPETPLPELDLISPNTPEQRSGPTTRDTPPPGMGEAARPSRRARPAISYAEPNLRDKMRRPTKELFDAVAGEGKFRGRNSIAPPETAQKHTEEGQLITQGKTPASQADVESANDQTMTKAELAVAKEASRRESVMSPTPGGHKDVPVEKKEEEELPSGITTQRRRRGSSMGPKETAIASASTMSALQSSTTSMEPVNFADRPKETPPAGAEDDVYDFNISSSALEERIEETKSVTSRSQSRKSRASTSFQENGSGRLNLDAAVGNKYVGRGKRASMAAAMSKLSQLELEDGEESSLETDGPPASMVSRRRSMML